MSSLCEEEALPARDEEGTEAAATALTALSISSKVGVDEDEEDESFLIPQRFTRSGRKKAVPFPMKLMKVLSDKQFNDIITWTPSGKSFTIVQAKAFVADILPEHFKSAKYSSFTRKLHRWGFTKHYRGEESGAFFHQDFQRDRLDLALQMTCKAEQTKPVSAIAKKAHSTAKMPAQLAASTGLSQSAPAMGVSSIPPPLQSHAPEVVGQSKLPASQAAAAVANRLDAAIEAEVTRRLHERLNQAALSRMFMQQQFNSPVIPMVLRLQLLEMQQKKLTAITNPRVPLARTRIRDTEGLEDLPRTNIQGAKTA